MTTTSMNLTDVEDHLDTSKEITAGLRTAAGSVVRLEDQCINACDGAPSASATLASISLLDLWANNDQDLRAIWTTLGDFGGSLNSSALSSLTGLEVPDGTYSPLDDALFSLNVIRDLLDTARQDDDKNEGVGAADADKIWSTNDLQAMIDNDDGYYTDAQVEHAKKVMALLEVSPDAREYLGITESGGGWSFSDIGHLTLDVFGMVPVVGNAADGINAAWYTSEGKYLDAALSSIGMIPGVGQLATLAKPAIKAAAAGVVFKSLDEALQWARKWLDEAGILGRNTDEAAGAARGADSAANRAAHESYVDDLIANMDRPTVTNVDLDNALEHIWRRGGTTGNGSTAAAVRAELANPGLAVGGSNHIQKAQDSINELQTWLRRNPDASLNDRITAEHIIRDMQNALDGR